jgi:hypothetical protein
MPPALDRRSFLRRTRDLALLALLPEPVLAQHLHEQASEGPGVYLSAERLRTLRVLCAHWIPGPPEDPDPGADRPARRTASTCCSAPSRKRPPIFAGGPFSHRRGGQITSPSSCRSTRSTAHLAHRGQPRPRRARSTAGARLAGAVRRGPRRSRRARSVSSAAFAALSRWQREAVLSGAGAR